jgi:hypothetical protein
LSGTSFRQRFGLSMSVGDGFVIAMAPASTDVTTAISGEVVPRRRGKSIAPNFTYDGPVSVIRLELDVSDARVRRRVERRALSRGRGDACR